MSSQNTPFQNTPPQNPPAQNTLNLAKQGDPNAIAALLTYHLSQRFTTTTSVIRLGNYLSVLVDVPFVVEQVMLVELVLKILQELDIAAISTIEISARNIGSQEVLWSQTIELANHLHRFSMNTDLTNSNPSTINSALTATSGSDTSGSDTSGTDTSGADASGTDTLSAAPEMAGLTSLLQRPETVALLAFALIVILWESYMEWMQEDDFAKPITGVKLAHRLGISPSTLSRNKQRSNFGEWSQQLDPNGIAWSLEGKGFLPRMD